MKRIRRGALAAELPLVLWALFILFLIPFIDLATVALRYTFVVAASRDAAFIAAKSKTFLSDISASQRSATHMADETARRTATAFSEITVRDVTTRILITNLTSRIITVSAVPLAVPANSSENLYEIEVTVNADINPLITFNASFLPNVPGLSAPVNVSVSSRGFCESPQGLTN